MRTERLKKGTRTEHSRTERNDLKKLERAQPTPTNGSAVSVSRDSVCIM